jgi:hypothetical protein
MPWRMPAASMASSGSAVKVRPLGWTVMVNVILAMVKKERLTGAEPRAQQPAIVANSDSA